MRVAMVVLLVLPLCIAETTFAAEAQHEAVLLKLKTQMAKYESVQAQLQAEAAALRAKGHAEKSAALEVEIKKLDALKAELNAKAAAIREQMATGDVKEAWKVEIIKKLQRKVSFEFVDTPLSEAIAFLRQLSNVSIVIDPAAREGVPALSLRVTDMSLESALRLMCKVGGAKYDLQDGAVYISLDEKAKQDRPEAKIPATAKLRVRLADGREIEADGSILAARPDLLERIINKFMGEEEEQGAAGLGVNYDVQGTLAPGPQAGTFKVQLKVVDKTDPAEPKNLTTPTIVIAKDKPGEMRIGNGKDEIVCRVLVGEGNVVAGQATVRVVKDGKLVARRNIVMPLVEPEKPPAPPEGKNQF